MGGWMGYETQGKAQALGPIGVHSALRWDENRGMNEINDELINNKYM